MTFLAPAALLGLLLLALPIVVHLFKPRKMRPTPFSSLRWLRQTHQRLSRRIQWHQWLLFLVRAGLITCLVLALARPLLGLRGPSRPTDRFLVLDAGRGMAYQDGVLPTPLERAQELAAQYAGSARPGDRTALLIAGSQAQLITPPVADATPHLAGLRAARPDGAEANLGSVLPVIQPLLPPSNEGRDAEIVFLTDNRQQAWRQGDVQGFVKQLDQPVRMQVVDVGPVAPHNAWIAGVRLLGRSQSNDKLLRVEVACVGDTRQERPVRLTGVAGMPDETQPVTPKPGPPLRVDFKIPADVPLAGQVAEVRLEPADALASDDRYFLCLDAPWSLRVLLIEPEARGPDVRGPGLHFHAAVEALTASGNHAIELVNRSAGSVTTADVQAADLVVLAGVPELNDATLETLEARVRGGAGLVIFLGPELKAAFYGQKLYKPLQPAEGLLPLPLKFGPGLLVRPSEPGMLIGVRWSHPLLAALHDPSLGDLTQCRFAYHASFSGDVSKSDRVLARFDDNAPALVEHPLGAGRVLLFNTTANDDWGDLPRRRCYVPLLDRMIAYLAAGGVQRHFTAGQPIVLPLPGWQTGDEIKVTAPDGERLTPQVRSLRGQAVLRLDPVREAGIYRVESPGRTLAFAINASRAGSRLVPMDSMALEQWWAPMPVEVVGAEAATQRWEPQAGKRALWPGLLLLAAVLLVVEMIYVTRLCPRVNPAVAASVVHRRGILRPVRVADNQ